MASERGERGPKGDHGQGGEAGERGKQGAIGPPGDPADPTVIAELILGIRRSLRVLVGATVLLYVVVALILLYTWRTSEANRSALCTLRIELERKVARSTEFLIKNPNGVPGIPAATIRAGIDSETKTIEALGDLDC